MRFGAVVGFIALAACSSQTMQSFVGRPIQDVFAYRGPPQNAYDMPDGRRAFQWIDTNTATTPVNVESRGSVAAGNGAASWTEATRISGGQTLTDRCVYTIYAGRAANSWVVTGFEKPSLQCE